jgi:transposase-like protein
MRAGHYERNLQTKAGEVRLKVPKLRQALIEELPDSATASARAFLSSTGSRPPHLV